MKNVLTILTFLFGAALYAVPVAKPTASDDGSMLALKTELASVVQERDRLAGELAKLAKAKANPACDCDSCECVICNCTPLAVGPPPDATIEAQPAIEPQQVAAVAENFTHPQPQVLPVKPQPKPQVLPVKAAPQATGRWVTYQSCGRGGCSTYQQWVPYSSQPAVQAAPVYQQQSYGSCGPGGCGRRGLFGRRR